MQKQAPTVGRLLTMVGFALSCFGLLLFLWLAFGGPVPLEPKGYRFHASFAEATQLAKEADVRISGVSVGKVKNIVPNKKSGRTDATIELDPKYAPLPKDSKAILRQKTLLGETYVELTPGDPANGTIPEDGHLAQVQVSPTVELDEILRAFDPKTRTAFENWMQTLAVSVKGRGQDFNDALGNLAPFAEDTDKLVEVLNHQSADVRRLVANTGVVFNALTARDHELQSLIKNSNTVFQTTARRNQQLADTFRALPTFENESKLTLAVLQRFAANADPLVQTELRPSAKQLSPTLTDLSALAPDLKALFKDLNPLIAASKRGLPATTRFLDELHPLLAASDAPLRQLNPILSFVSLYKEELSAFFSNTVAATEASNIPPGGSASSPKVHYLRTTNPLSPDSLAVQPERTPFNRSNPYVLPGAFRGLNDGLQSYETRFCNKGAVPSLGGTSDALLGLIPQALRDNILKFAGFSSGVVAPPCVQQGKYKNIDGTLTQYPHVIAATNGASTSRHARAKTRSHR